MQSFTQKYAIIQLFETMPVGTRLSADNWPLHSTVADTFAIGWDESTIGKLTRLLTDKDPYQRKLLATIKVGD